MFVLVVRDHLDGRANWMRQIHYFGFVLELISDELAATNTTLANKVREPIDGFAYLDISSLNASEFTQFWSAVIRVYDRILQRYRQKLDELNVYGIYWMMHLSELKTVLRIDPRVEPQPAFDTGKIILDDTVFWEAPNWVYDLMLELFGMEMLAKDQTLADFLFASRVETGNNICDLRSFNRAQLQHLIEPTTERYYPRYVENELSSGHDPRFKTELFPRIKTLCELLQHHLS